MSCIASQNLLFTIDISMASKSRDYVMSGKSCQQGCIRAKRKLNSMQKRMLLSTELVLEYAGGTRNE